MNIPAGKAQVPSESEKKWDSECSNQNGWHETDMKRLLSQYYTELYYHVVWGTHHRRPMMVPQMQNDLYRFLIYKCKQCNFQLFAVNGMEDHVHLVLRLRPTISVSEAIGILKGSTSHFCNNTLKPPANIRWQGGYGAFTFSARDQPKIVTYVQNQKTRHQKHRLHPHLEQSGETYNYCHPPSIPKSFSPHNPIITPNP